MELIQLFASVTVLAIIGGAVGFTKAKGRTYYDYFFEKEYEVPFDEEGVGMVVVDASIGGLIGLAIFAVTHL